MSDTGSQTNLARVRRLDSLNGLLGLVEDRPIWDDLRQLTRQERETNLSDSKEDSSFFFSDSNSKILATRSYGKKISEPSSE
jgi:hypothetical protein